MTTQQREASGPPSAQSGTGLQLRGITKRFGSLVANDSIDLDICPGEIHCLLGENGAGKSTLMNVLYGLFQPDEGEILIDGVRHVSKNPKEAMAVGIGMVHQHFMLVEVFTVAENLILGREQATAGVLNMNAARETVRELSDRYRLAVDPDALIEDLPVGVQQRVEILKALAGGATYLIFDEPTAVLTPQEIDELMEVMRSLRDEGKAIVFITHKLREVRAIADRITVIRHGKVVGEAQPEESEAQLAELMVGRAVNLRVQKAPASPSEQPRLVLENVGIASGSGALVVDGCDLEVFGGEIVCVAGVQGNGQTELAEALLGVIAISRGRVTLDGKPMAASDPKQTIDDGLGFVPEDRKHDGFVGTFTVAENLVLNHFDEPPYARGPALDLKAIRQQRRAPGAGVRHPHPVDRQHRVRVVRREPAEGGAGPRAVPAAVGPDRQPTHPGGRRRRHRVPAQAAGRGTRQGHRGDDRVHRVGRGRRAGRPGRGHVPRPDRRHRPTRHLPGGSRSDDGRGAGGGGARRGADGSGGGRSVSGAAD